MQIKSCQPRWTKLQTRRKAAVQEMLRVLRPGGRLLIFVWAFEQRRGGHSSAYLNQAATNAPKTPTTLPNTTLPQSHTSPLTSLPVHVNRTEFKQQDLLVPWEQKAKSGAESERHLRFYHVFREGELPELATRLPAAVLETWYEQGNWAAVLEKQSPRLRDALTVVSKVICANSTLRPSYVTAADAGVLL